MIRSARPSFGASFWQPRTRPRFRGGAVADAFSPADLASMAFWLVASSGDLNQSADGTGSTSGDLDPVGLWPDQSGNDYDFTQSISDDKPTLRSFQINGEPTVDLDGTNDYLVANSSLQQGNDLMVFAAFRITSAFETGARVLAERDGDAGAGRWIIDGNADGSIRMFYEDGSAQQVSGNTAVVSTNTAHIVVAYIRNGAVGIRLDGQAYSEGAHGGLTSSGLNTSLGAQTTGGLAGDNGSIDYAEVGGYATGHSDEDIQSLESYFAEKYGVTLA